MNGGSKCLLKNHDALLSFSQRWRSAPSRLPPLPQLRLARCMPSRWFGRSRAFTSWGARPRCTRRGRNPKATSMIHSLPCCWDEDASPLFLLCPARPRKAEMRRARPQRFPSSHAHRAWRGGVGGGEQSAVILTSPPNPLALHSTAAADRRARRDRRRGRLSLLRRLELHDRPDHRRRRRRHHRGGVNSSSDVYVIGPFGGPLPLQSLHFPALAASRAGILDGAME